MTTFKKTESMSHAVYELGLQAKKFRFNSVFDDTPIKSLFVKKLHNHIRSTVYTWWSYHSNADVQTMEANAMAATDLVGVSKAAALNSGSATGG